MNFVYTGVMAERNDALSTSATIWAPPLVTTSSDLASCSSHFLRWNATDYLAVARNRSWSALGSLSYTAFDITSISGAIECSVRE